MTGAPREERVFYLWSAFWVSEFRYAEFRYPELRYPEELAGRSKERLDIDEYALEKKLVACKAEFDPLATLMKELLGGQTAGLCQRATVRWPLYVRYPELHYPECGPT